MDISQQCEPVVRSGGQVVQKHSPDKEKTDKALELTVETDLQKLPRGQLCHTEEQGTYPHINRQ